MSFFTDTDKKAGSPFEPKRKFRWIVSFSSIGQEAYFMATKVDKPSANMETTKHDFLNHQFKFPNKVIWQPITVSFIDSFDANMGSKFYNMLRGSGYSQPASFDESLTGLTKANMAAAIGEVKIYQLDGGDVESVTPDKIVDDPNPSFLAANIREEWLLKNSLVTSMKFGAGMSYTETGLVEVELGLEYDYATYTDRNSPFA